MPGNLLHLNAAIQCTHLAPAQIAPDQTRVLVSGQPVATLMNAIPVTGCPFQIPVGAGTKPQPCVLVKWANVAGRIRAMGSPVLLQAAIGTGAGVCQSAEQIPQGPPQVTTMQVRVRGM